MNGDRLAPFFELMQGMRPNERRDMTVPQKGQSSIRRAACNDQRRQWAPMPSEPRTSGAIVYAHGSYKNMEPKDDLNGQSGAVLSENSVNQMRGRQLNRSTDNERQFQRHLTLNATIRNVNEWSEHQGLFLNLLFDVYAVLDSQVICNRFGGSQFTVRDQTGSLRVTYYEMEEEMIPVNIGEWLRIVGVVRPWGFQATSVRHAEPNFLKGLREKIAASSVALKNRLEQLQL